MMDIRPFDRADRDAVGILLDTAFDGSAERLLVEALRLGGDMAVELVASEGGRVLGYVGFARLIAPAGWLSLSPIAVSRGAQGQGLGGELIRYGLDLARQSGAQAVTVLGDAEYYTRFGFTRKAAENLAVPYPKSSYLLYPIAPNTAGLAAEVIYPPAFQSV